MADVLNRDRPVMNGDGGFESGRAVVLERRVQPRDGIDDAEPGARRQLARRIGGIAGMAEQSSDRRADIAVDDAVVERNRVADRGDIARHDIDHGGRRLAAARFRRRAKIADQDREIGIAVRSIGQGLDLQLGRGAAAGDHALDRRIAEQAGLARQAGVGIPAVEIGHPALDRGLRRKIVGAGDNLDPARGAAAVTAAFAPVRNARRDRDFEQRPAGLGDIDRPVLALIMKQHGRRPVSAWVAITEQGARAANAHRYVRKRPRPRQPVSAMV